MLEAKFLNSLEVESIDDGKWKLTKPLGYESVLFDTPIIAPLGFVTDFASVPRVPIAYMLFGDRAHHESVIHDYLYQTHLTSKAIADKIFLEAMKVRGKSLFIRSAMYLGVKIGGCKSYRTGKDRYLILNKNGNN